MKLAILSDIHANLHALEAVWEDLQADKPDAVYCLGDLVGYGAYPNEVVEFIRSREVTSLMGNYDEGVGFDLEDCGCVYKNHEEDQLGRASLLWSRAETNPKNKQYLRSLPMQMRLPAGHGHLLLVHGSPRRTNEYLYEDRPLATFERIAKMADCEVILFGHTHLPYRKQVNSTWFVNCGSVGKPKDGDWRACYVIADFGFSHRFEFRRVPYDIEAAAGAIRRSDLPDHFAVLLETGGLTPEQGTAHGVD